jgi:hypothetical protein
MISAELAAPAPVAAPKATATEATTAPVAIPALRIVVRTLFPQA